VRGAGTAVGERRTPPRRSATPGRRAAAGAAVACAALALGGPAARADDAPVSAFAFARDPRVRREIDLALVRKGIPVPDPKDGIPAIRRPRAVPAAEAAFLKDDDAVVGVAVGEEARAYPVRILDRHEVANDVVGGVPLAVTYCPLCDSAVAFRRDVDLDPAREGEPPLVFGVSGYLYESDVLLYDDRTETFWAQMTGRGVVGPQTGRSLERVPVVRTTWGAWKRARPKTTALSTETEHGFAPTTYATPVYVEYRASRQLMFPVSRLDGRLPKKTIVYGVAVGEDATAIPADALPKAGESATLAIGERSLRLTTDAATGAPRVEVSRPGAPETFDEVAAVRAYWFAWAAFHPGTRLAALPRASEEGR
jgi:hypothetical protein